MKSITEYLWFETRQREEFVRITDEVTDIVSRSGIQEGFCLVSAMHITSAVYVNDWEDGLIEDINGMAAWTRAYEELPTSPDRRG